MSYDRLSPRERDVLNALIDSDQGMFAAQAIALKLGISERRVKRLLTVAALKYGIDSRQWVMSVRLVYLRAKELGLI